jgi:Cu/Ag efflux protein CusF
MVHENARSRVERGKPRMLAFTNATRLSRLGLFASALLLSAAPLLLPLDAVRAQGMSNMESMSAKGAVSGSGTGTITAINTEARKVTIDHGPIPAIKWPAMKMEFPVAPSVDLSKVKTGDRVMFTLSGSNNSYTVQSMTGAK